MKGTIIKCLEQLVITQFGKDVWEKILVDSGLDAFTTIWPLADFDDQLTLQLVGATCENLNISLEQAADAFGDYWVNVYSQKTYPVYYRRNKTARDFLLNMDKVHVEMTRRMKNARPPRFDYEWEDEQTLLIHYKSHRGLVDFAVGLARGIGKYYGEELKVSKSGPDKVRVIFA